jgi:hypothetical protein
VSGMDILLRTEQPRVLVVAVGQLAETAVAVGERLSDQGIGVTVLDPVWALPVNPALAKLAVDHDLVITIEDNGVVGGYGARVAQQLRAAGVSTPVREFGIPQEFLPHGSRAELLMEIGLTPQNIARYAVEAVVSADESFDQPTRADLSESSWVWTQQDSDKSAVIALPRAGAGCDALRQAQGAWLHTPQGAWLHTPQGAWLHTPQCFGCRRRSTLAQRTEATPGAKKRRLSTRSETPSRSR